MRDIIRCVVLVFAWAVLALGFALAAPGCATIKKYTPAATRAAVCCARCIVDEWRELQANPPQAEPAPFSR